MRTSRSACFGAIRARVVAAGKWREKPAASSNRCVADPLTLEQQLQRAGAYLRSWAGECDGLILACGAGMSVDSGIPDYRGSDGRWTQAPHLLRKARPEHFRKDPAAAWGEYVRRWRDFTAAAPHEGYAAVLRLAKGRRWPVACYSSNVDGLAQRAGFDVVHEVHGSHFHWQCATPCTQQVWPMPMAWSPQLDDAGGLVGAPPRCAHCNGPARPAVLFFGDLEWVPARSREQYQRYRDRFAGVSKPLVLEVGAGSMVPTIRNYAESVAHVHVRVTLEEPFALRERRLVLSGSAEPALRGVEAALN